MGARVNHLTLVGQPSTVLSPQDEVVGLVRGAEPAGPHPLTGLRLFHQM